MNGQTTGPSYPMGPGPEFQGAPNDYINVTTCNCFTTACINKRMQIPMIGLDIESIVSFPHNTSQIGKGAGDDRGVLRGGPVSQAGPGPLMARRLCQNVYKPNLEAALLFKHFLPCDALRCTVFVIVILSVRMSVCPSVTLVHCVHMV